MKGKLILIEGTDCSGKQTQSELLVKRLNKAGYRTVRLSFPMYETPTGKIIGGPYLGKEAISESWFTEGANSVNPQVASLYYAADRLYNIDKIDSLLASGTTVILDRYTPSNMAHQGGKISSKEERYAMYKWIDELEYGFLKLPRPDFSFLLYLPHEYAQELRKTRVEKLDDHEKSEEHLKNAEKAYLELAALYHFDIIDCVSDKKIDTIEVINDRLYESLQTKLNN
ncbi:MAG: thymidylate kinase [Bacilli bacterium]